MRFNDLLVSVDGEQKMSVCVLDNNKAETKLRISGDAESIFATTKTSLHNASVDTIAARENETLWVWIIKPMGELQGEEPAK